MQRIEFRMWTHEELPYIFALHDGLGRDIPVEALSIIKSAKNLIRKERMMYGRQMGVFYINIDTDDVPDKVINNNTIFLIDYIWRHVGDIKDLSAEIFDFSMGFEELF